MTLTIGIDIGGTKVLGGVVDENGKILATQRVPTPKEGGAALTKTIADVANHLLKDHDVVALGVSAAGLISSDRETILATGNISGWNGVNLKEELNKFVDLPIFIENDANSAAWGESRYGAGVGEDHMLILTIGTGVGGGAIIDGKLLRGAHGISAEFGHIRVVPEGQLCSCGARGCLEQYASGNALMRHVREAISASPDAAYNLLARGDGTLEGLTGHHITQAARDGDPIALAGFNTTAQWLGAGIASLSALFDPACVVIGGGVIEAGEILLAPTRAALERLIPFSGRRPIPKVVAAILGNDAGLVGAADLARS
jgi:glucokinase